MIDFKDAISVAHNSATTLINHAKNIRLEGALTSSDGTLYEIAFSYDIDGDDLEMGAANESNLARLVKIMGRRREQKLFLVDSQTGAFRGFQNHKNG